MISPTVSVEVTVIVKAMPLRTPTMVSVLEVIPSCANLVSPVICTLVVVWTVFTTGVVVVVVVVCVTTL